MDNLVKDTFIDSVEDNPIKVEQQIELQKVKKEVAKRLINYKKTIDIIAADAPLQVLCLTNDIEAILIANGFNRVYDILNVDFTEIKGLGAVRIRKLTARLNEFLSVF